MAGMVRLNLAPEKKPLIDPKLLEKIPIIPIFFGLIVFGIYYYLFNIYTPKLDDELSQLEQKFQELKKEKKRKLADKEEVKSSLEDQVANIRSQVELRRRLIGVNMYHWSDILSDLTKILPPKTVWIRSFDAEDGENITLDATAKAPPEAIGDDKKKVFVEVARLIKTINESTKGRYRNVKVNQLTKSIQQNTPVVNFRIQFSVDRQAAVMTAQSEEGSGSDTGEDEENTESE